VDAFAYLLKPFALEDLEDAVTRALAESLTAA
jgi:DNA-binding NtrC family response regulator